MVTKMSDPINVVVSCYPTLAVYYDSEAEKKAIFARMSLDMGAGATAAERARTERKIDAVSWKLRWTTQKAAKFETLMGIYNFPTNNLMLTGALDLGTWAPPHFDNAGRELKLPPTGIPFDIAPLVLEKLEELHQKFLTNPELTVRLQTTEPSNSVHRPDFDLELHA